MKGFSAIFSLFHIGSVDSKNFHLLAFFAPFVVRSIPELLMGGYITGFDTIGYYVPVTWKWVNYGVGFWEFLALHPFSTFCCQA
jgi:hypothetical protein